MPTPNAIQVLLPGNGTAPPNEAGTVTIVAYASDYGADGPISGIPAWLRVVKGIEETVTVAGRFDKCTPQEALTDETGEWQWQNPPSSAYSVRPGDDVRLINVYCKDPPIDKFFVLPDSGGNLVDFPDVE